MIEMTIYKPSGGHHWNHMWWRWCHILYIQEVECNIQLCLSLFQAACFLWSPHTSSCTLDKPPWFRKICQHTVYRTDVHTSASLDQSLEISKWHSLPLLAPPSLYWWLLQDHMWQGTVATSASGHLPHVAGCLQFGHAMLAFSHLDPVLSADQLLFQ